MSARAARATVALGASLVVRAMACSSVEEQSGAAIASGSTGMSVVAAPSAAASSGSASTGTGGIGGSGASSSTATSGSGGDGPFSLGVPGLTIDSHVIGTAITTDPKGNVIVGGMFEGSASFGLGAISSVEGAPGMVIAKLDHSGKPLWSKPFGKCKPNYSLAVPNSIRSDSGGNLLITGMFNTEIDFGGGKLTGNGFANGFAAKLSPDGDYIYGRTLGQQDYSVGAAQVLAANGDAFVTGYCTGTVDFGGGPIGKPGVGHAFILRLDPSGKHLASVILESVAAIPGNLFLDATGNLVVTFGVTSMNKIDFGAGPLPLGWAVARFDPSGKLLSSKSFPITGAKPPDPFDHQALRGSALDAAGHLVLYGTVNAAAGGAQVDFGGKVLALAPGLSLIVASLDQGGTPLFAKAFADPGLHENYWAGPALAVDGADNVLIAGLFDQSVDFGGGKLSTPSNSSSLFVAKLDNGGGFVWQRAFGMTMGLHPGATVLSVDASGASLLTGSYIGSGFDFGQGKLPGSNPGAYALYAARLAP
jgi:hypothetical protein